MTKGTERALIGFIASVLLGGCDRATQLPTMPDPIPASPTTPLPTPSPVSLSRLAITGAEALTAAGRSLQLKATAILSDGSEADVSANVAWRSEKPDLAAVSASGMVRILAAGDVDIVAIYNTLSATARITAGYDVSGILHEADPFTRVPVAEAEVEVIGGELAGQTTVTDSEGRFSLPPVTNAGFELQFKKRGYDTRRYSIVRFPRDVHPSVSLLQKQKTFTWELNLLDYDLSGDNLLGYSRSFPISISRSSPVTLGSTGTGDCNLQGTYTDTWTVLRDGPSPPMRVFPYQNEAGTLASDAKSETVKGGKYTLSIGFSNVWRSNCLLSVTLLYH